MTVQIIGGALICLSTTLLGLYMGGAAARRSKDLMELKKSLILLKSQMDFAIYTLPQAFCHISGRVAPPFSEFYAKLAKELENNKADAATVWAQGIEGLSRTNLSKEDLDNFGILGMSLGHMDVTVQINSIDMIIAAIDDSLTQLRTDGPKTTKMYRGLGVASGLLITIVLL